MMIRVWRCGDMSMSICLILLPRCRNTDNFPFLCDDIGLELIMVVVIAYRARERWRSPGRGGGGAKITITRIV